MERMMTIKAHNRRSDLTVQLAHIGAVQEELALLQWQVINIVKDPKLHVSPAIVVGQLLTVCLALLIAGISIGVLF